MQAKTYELRATTSLARLLRDTNRRDEARGMLAEIYNWFTEGLDTADLKDAKALLEELKSSLIMWGPKPPRRHGTSRSEAVRRSTTTP
jgi:predicted ATPase